MSQLQWRHALDFVEGNKKFTADDVFAVTLTYNFRSEMTLISLIGSFYV